MPCTLYLDTSILCALADPPARSAYARTCQSLTRRWLRSLPQHDLRFPKLDDASKAEIDAAFACIDSISPSDPDDIPIVEGFTPEFLRTLPAKNRAMHKYGYLKMVREYEDFVRSHPELDKD